MEPEREAFERRIGTTVRGKWTLERLLGYGGMAAVYVGVHKIGRRDAIKILHPEVARSKDIRARFEREAHAANRFEHPGAVEIRDYDTTEDGAPFLVMELLEGESLAALARRLGGIPTPELLRIVDELLDVLAAAHAQGIIHRDIKLDNLFVRADGKLKVLDFGIARIVDDDPGGFKTRTGARLGTVAYMPPEQVRGQAIDARADLFAVGATMFRLVAKRRIHEAPSDPELVVKMAGEPAPPLASVAPDAPPGLCAVVDRALAFDRERRYPDATTMQSDVRALRAGQAPPYAMARLAAGDLPNPPRGGATASLRGPLSAGGAGAAEATMAATPGAREASAVHGGIPAATEPTFAATPAARHSPAASSEPIAAATQAARIGPAGAASEPTSAATQAARIGPAGAASEPASAATPVAGFVPAGAASEPTSAAAPVARIGSAGGSELMVAATPVSGSHGASSAALEPTSAATPLSAGPGTAPAPTAAATPVVPAPPIAPSPSTIPLIRPTGTIAMQAAGPVSARSGTLGTTIMNAVPEPSPASMRAPVAPAADPAAAAPSAGLYAPPTLPSGPASVRNPGAAVPASGPASVRTPAHGAAPPSPYETTLRSPDPVVPPSALPPLRAERAIPPIAVVDAPAPREPARAEPPAAPPPEPAKTFRGGTGLVIGIVLAVVLGGAALLFFVGQSGSPEARPTPAPSASVPAKPAAPPAARPKPKLTK